ncbi:hypothetical protein HYZ98_03815, partial [Candidatus Peregrinibacteria bacterium]|nr:hypothetical protein [Candidatus Peregrinibacteria bacterium]
MIPYQNTHCFPSLSPRERRMCHMSPESEKPQPKPVTKEDLLKGEGVEKEVKTDFDALVGDVEKQMDEGFGKVKGLPDEFKVTLKNQIAFHFMKTTMEIFAGEDRILQREEFARFREQTLKQITVILQTMGAESAEKKEEEEEKKKALKSVEEEIRDLEGDLQELNAEENDIKPEDLTLDPAQTEQNLEKVQNAIGKYNNRQHAVSAVQKNMGEKFQEATEVQQAFQQSHRGTGDFGKDLVSGGRTARAIAQIFIAPVGLIWQGVHWYQLQGEAEKANKAIEAFRTNFNERKDTLKGVINDMQADGGALSRAPDNLRQAAETFRTNNRNTLSQQHLERSTEQEAMLKKRAEFDTLRGTLTGHRDSLEDARDTMGKSRNHAEFGAQQLGGHEGEIQHAINQIELSGVLHESRDPEKKKAIEEKYARLKQARDGIHGRVNDMTVGGKNMDAVLSNAQGNIDQIDGHLQDVLTARGSIDTFINDLGSQIDEIDAQLGLNDVQTEELLRGISEIDGQVTEGVDTVVSQNLQALTAVELQGAMLETMKVEAPSLLGHMTDGIIQVFKFPFEGAGYGLTKLSDGFQWAGEQVGIPKWATRIVTAPTRIAAGVFEGAGELVEGAGSLAKGVLTLPAYALGKLGPEGSAWRQVVGCDDGAEIWGALGKLTWAGMGKGLIAYDTFAEGEIEKGIGKAVLNTALFFIPGAGEVGPALRAAAAAGAGTTKTIGMVTLAVARGTGTSYAGMARGLGRGLGRAGTSLRNMTGGISKSEMLMRNGAALTSAGDARLLAVSGTRIGGRTLGEIFGDRLTTMTPKELTAQVLELQRTGHLPMGSGDIGRLSASRHLLKEAAQCKTAGTALQGASKQAAAVERTAGEAAAAEGAVEGAGARAGRMEGGRLERAADKGLDDFLNGRSKTIRSKDVANEIAETDSLLRSPHRTPEELVQLQQQRVQLQSLQKSIRGVQRARVKLKNTKVATGEKLDAFLNGKSNTINRPSIAKEIQACDDILKNPAIDDATRVRLTQEIENFTDLYNNVDNIQVSRGLPSKPLNRPTSTVAIPEGATAGTIEAVASGVPLRVSSRAYRAGRAVRNLGTNLYNRPLVGAPLRGVGHVVDFCKHPITNTRNALSWVVNRGPVGYVRRGVERAWGTVREWRGRRAQRPAPAPRSAPARPLSKPAAGPARGPQLRAQPKSPPARLPSDYRSWSTDQLQNAFQERRMAQSQGVG